MKKNYLALSLLASATLMLSACGEDKSAVSTAHAASSNTVVVNEKSSFEDKASYAVGASVGTYIATLEKDQQNVLGSFNHDLVMQGFKDALNNKTALNDEQMQEVLVSLDNKLRDGLQQKYEAAALENLQKGEEFLKENAKKEGVKTTASGLQYKVLAEGTGKTPDVSSTVMVKYKGTTIDGTVFDEQKEPIALPLANIIPGWTEGLQLMKEGGKVMLYIPSDLAYGEMGAGNKIAPNSTLIFEIELVSVEPAKGESK